MAVVHPGEDRTATAKKLIAEYGAGNVTTRSEIGSGVVFVIPDEPKPKARPRPAKSDPPSDE